MHAGVGKSGVVREGDPLPIGVGVVPPSGFSWWGAEVEESSRDEHEEREDDDKETPIYRLLRIEMVEEGMTVPFAFKHEKLVFYLKS